MANSRIKVLETGPSHSSAPRLKCWRSLCCSASHRISAYQAPSMASDRAAPRQLLCFRLPSPSKWLMVLISTPTLHTRRHHRIKLCQMAMHLPAGSNGVLQLQQGRITENNSASMSISRLHSLITAFKSMCPPTQKQQDSAHPMQTISPL